jgi:hypothetical protein
MVAHIGGDRYRNDDTKAELFVDGSSISKSSLLIYTDHCMPLPTNTTTHRVLILVMEEGKRPNPIRRAVIM